LECQVSSSFVNNALQTFVKPHNARQ